MPVITSIRPQKRKERFNIFLEGRYAFAVSSDILLREGLKVDQEISESQVEALIKKDEFSSVLDKTLKFLSYRPRSEWEIRQYLVKKQVGEETRKLILGKLNRLKLVDDQAFARWWVEQRSNFRPTGLSLIKMELKQKGISNELIEEIFADEKPLVDERQKAEELAIKKLKSMINLPVLKSKTRLYGILSRRGFSYEVIKETIDKLFKKE